MKGPYRANIQPSFSLLESRVVTFGLALAAASRVARSYLGSVPDSRSSRAPPPGLTKPQPRTALLVRVAAQHRDPHALDLVQGHPPHRPGGGGAVLQHSHLRHLRLTDLARSSWELHAIASFASHRSLSSTLLYIHISGRELTAHLASGMAQIHSRRVAMIPTAFAEPKEQSR